MASITLEVLLRYSLSFASTAKNIFLCGFWSMLFVSNWTCISLWFFFLVVSQPNFSLHAGTFRREKKAIKSKTNQRLLIEHTYLKKNKFLNCNLIKHMPVDEEALLRVPRLNIFHYSWSIVIQKYIATFFSRYKILIVVGNFSFSFSSLISHNCDIFLWGCFCCHFY